MSISPEGVPGVAHNTDVPQGDSHRDTGLPPITWRAHNTDVPPGVIRLRIKGEFKLNRAPHYRDAEGWDVFHLNAATIDWADSCNAARRQLLGDAPTPESDRRYEQMLRERDERIKREEKEKRAAA